MVCVWGEWLGGHQTDHFLFKLSQEIDQQFMSAISKEISQVKHNVA